MRRGAMKRWSVMMILLLAVMGWQACAPTFEGKLRQGAEIQKGLFDVAQQAAIGVYETTWQVWLSQVKAGTLSPADYKAKIARMDKKMNDLAVIVRKGKAAQRALLDGLTLLEKGAGSQANLLGLQAEFITFVTSVVTAVEDIRAASR